MIVTPDADHDIAHAGPERASVVAVLASPRRGDLELPPAVGSHGSSLV
jgi:hypothetical protein